MAVRIEGHTPLELATELGERGIFTWDGNYYALNVTEQLGVERLGGFLRIGLVHYNTTEEGEGLLAALREIVGRESRAIGTQPQPLVIDFRHSQAHVMAKLPLTFANVLPL